MHRDVDRNVKGIPRFTLLVVTLSKRTGPVHLLSTFLALAVVTVSPQVSGRAWPR